MNPIVHRPTCLCGWVGAWEIGRQSHYLACGAAELHEGHCAAPETKAAVESARRSEVLRD